MKKKITLSLLLASTLTVLSGALISPASPAIDKAFADVPNGSLLTKLVLTLPALVIALFSPVAGNIIDKNPRLPFFNGCLLLYALAGGAGFFINNIYLLLLSRAALGLAVSGIMTTATTLAGDYFDQEDRNKFYGNQGAFMALGGTVFIILAGFLADIHWHYPFLIYGLSLVVLLLSSLHLHEPERQQSVSMEKPRLQKADKRKVYFIYLLTFSGMLIFYLIPVQAPFLINQVGISKGVLISIALVTSTIFSAVAGASYIKAKRKLGFRTIFIISFSLMSAGYLILWQANDYYVIVAGMLVAGTGFGWLMPNGNTWLISLTPPLLRGKLIGILTSTVFLGQFFSPVAANPVVENFSLSIVFAFGAFLALGMVLLITIQPLIRKKAES